MYVPMCLGEIIGGIPKDESKCRQSDGASKSRNTRVSEL